MEYFLYGKLLPDGSAPLDNPSYHIRPTNQIPMVYAEDETFFLGSAKWQIDHPNSSRKLINSKIENTSFWKEFWERGRCIIPALGYFEWSDISGRKEPYVITVKRNAPVMFFAGFYTTGKDGNHSCSILTRKPAKQIEHIHNRMPVILSPEEIQDWLQNIATPEQSQETLGASWEGRFEYHRVKPFTKDSEGSELIEPYDPPQGSFDF